MEHDMNLRYWECKCMNCQRMQYMHKADQARPMSELLQLCNKLLERSE